MILESTIEIERPIDELFKKATCDGRCVIWTGITDLKMDRDERTAGSTLTKRSKFLSYTSRNKVITELDPSHIFPFGELEGRGRNSARVFMVRDLLNNGKD